MLETNADLDPETHPDLLHEQQQSAVESLYSGQEMEYCMLQRWRWHRWEQRVSVDRICKHVVSVQVGRGEDARFLDLQQETYKDDGVEVGAKPLMYERAAMAVGERGEHGTSSGGESRAVENEMQGEIGEGRQAEQE
jgi:hypothetical protein